MQIPLLRVYAINNLTSSDSTLPTILSLFNHCGSTVNNCVAHYTQQRFESYITVDPHTSCWLWQRACNTSGYGVAIHHNKHWLAHRLACVLYRVTNYQHIQSNVVLHRCDTPQCCNPQHLQIGTQRENMVDAKHKGRWGTFKKNC